MSESKRVGPYKIKGSGDVRTVIDVAGVTVGTVHRHSAEAVSGRSTGGRTMQFRKFTEVWWTAKHADGRPVIQFGRAMGTGLLKAWAAPWRWADSLAEYEAKDAAGGAS